MCPDLVTAVKRYPMDDVKRWLEGNSHIPPDLLPQLLANICPLLDEAGGFELGVLEERKRHGGPAVIVSRHPRNLLIKWRDSLFAVVPALVGAAATVVGEPITGTIACLAAVYQLAKTTAIELGEDHARTVLALWREFENKNPVDLALLTKALSGFEERHLRDVLNDLAALGVLELVNKSVLKRDQLILRKES